MKELKVSAIREGTVIDHIPSDATFKVVDILNLENVDNVVSVATNLPSKKLGKKGIIKVGGKDLTKEEVDKIALIAPNATLNLIKNYGVVKKIRLDIPDNIYGIVKCFNPKCITNSEPMKTKFSIISKNPLILRCMYCERTMRKDDVELL